MKLKKLLFILTLCICSANLFAADIYVSSSGNDTTGDGTQGNPYATIKIAEGFAVSGDKIIIVGSITETGLTTITDKNLTFEGASNATITRTSGRFVDITGTATVSFSNITFQNFNTGFQGVVLQTTSNNVNVSFTDCLFQNNVGTVQNGNVIHIGNADATFTRCTFYNNTATAANGRGAAIIFGGSFTGIITNCTFYQNKLTTNPDNTGAAIVTFNNVAAQQLTITNSLFVDNTQSDGDSMDVFCAPSSNLTMINSLAQAINQPTTFVNTDSNITAAFTNTTFSFVSPNVTFTAPNLLTDATPIDFGTDNNDAGSWDSKINIFRGTTNLSWAANTNWSSGAVPVGDGTEDIAILAVCNMFADGVAVNNIKVTSQLRIQNGKVFIVNGTSEVTGLVRYFRDLTDDADNAKAWHLVSSPLSGEVFDAAFADKNDITTSPSSNRGIASYNPSQTGSAAWSYLSASNPSINATSGQGFSMKITPDGITFVGSGGEYADNAVGFEGDFNTDNVTINTSVGFNLLGNPYAAHVNSGTFLTDNSANLDSETIWVWNQITENYESYLSGIGFILAPAQGFFVNSKGANLDFFESNQATTGGTFQKSSKTEVKLMMNDGTADRFAKMYYLDNVTKGFDNGFDGETFGGIENSVDVFTHLLADNEVKKYQVQSLPISEMETMIIPVGVKAAAGKEITFTAEAINLPGDTKVFLEDRLTNTMTRLDEANASYKVTLNDVTDGTGRFYLHTKASSVLSTDDVLFQSVNVFAINNNNLRVVGLSQGNASLKLYNILGKQVMQASFTATNVKDISLPKLATGIYIVQLETAAGKLNKKIVLE